MLLVDDDQVILACLEALLDAHFHITAATSFVAARKVLDDRRFDVVLTDYELPDATGLGLLELIQRKYPTTFGMLLTGHANHPLVQRAQTSGHSLRVILKPYDPDMLLSALKTAVSIATMRSATRRLISRNL